MLTIPGIRAQLHLTAVGQPKTEKQQLCRQLIRMLAVFSTRNVHETSSSQKYLTEKIFASQDFGQQYATISKTRVL